MQSGCLLQGRTDPAMSVRDFTWLSCVLRQGTQLPSTRGPVYPLTWTASREKMLSHLAYRKPTFKLSQRAIDLLERLPHQARPHAEWTLRRIGDWCVDNATDGRVSENDLREIAAVHFSAWRYMQAHVWTFIRIGVLEDLGQGDYLLAFFDEYHAPAWLQEKRLRERREKGRLRNASYREVVRTTKSNVDISSTSVPCDTCTNGITSLSSVTNNSQHPAEIEAPVTQCAVDNSSRPMVGSQKSMTEDEPWDATSAVARLRQVHTEAYGEPEPPVAVPEEPEEPATPVIPESAAPKLEPRRALRPARMPQEQRPVWEDDVVSAAKRLHLPLTRVPALHQRLQREGVTDVQLGHAVWVTARRRDVWAPELYLFGVLENQRLLRSGRAPPGRGMMAS